MKLFLKGLSVVLFYTVSAALMIYAGSRTLNFVTQTLPEDQQIIGFLALAATSFGSIAWLMVFLYSAGGTGQRVISVIMVAIDLLGEVVLFTADSLLTTGQNGLTVALLPEEVRLIVLAMSGLIAINIFSTIAYHVVDPEALKRMKESSVRDQLEQNALNEIEKRGEELARRMAPALADTWAKDFEERFSDLGSLGLGNAEKSSPRKQIAASRPAPQIAVSDQNAQPEAVTVSPFLAGMSPNGHKNNGAGG